MHTDEYVSENYIVENMDVPVELIFVSTIPKSWFLLSDISWILSFGFMQDESLVLTIQLSTICRCEVVTNNLNAHFSFYNSYYVQRFSVLKDFWGGS